MAHLPEYSIRIFLMFINCAQKFKINANKITSRSSKNKTLKVYKENLQVIEYLSEISALKKQEKLQNDKLTYLNTKYLQVSKGRKNKEATD